MNFVIDTQSKTITIKESYKLYDMVQELEKRFTKEELKDYVIIPGVTNLFNPWQSLGSVTLGGPNMRDGKTGPPYNSGINPYEVKYDSGTQTIVSTDGK